MSDQTASMAKSYPSELIRNWALRDGTRVVIRPIRPEDRRIEKDFVHNLSGESKYFRFMSSVHDLSEGMLTRFTEIDYDTQMALIAVVAEGGRELEIGVARYVVNPDGESCEFAIAIADAWQRRGIGSMLMKCLMDAARDRELETMEGLVLASNHKMLALMDALGFKMEQSADDPAVRHVVKILTAIIPPAAIAPDAS